MGLLELLGIAIGLSMDAFAVSLCKGLAMPRFDAKKAGIIALFFGGFQAIMPLIGWALGQQFQRYITAYDHWIAFGLLAVIGGKMVYEALRGGEDDGARDGGLKLKELLILAVATSIDALAVGITFSFFTLNILPTVALIGATTFVISLAGVALGSRFGERLAKRAEVFGGVVLVIIGAKILLEHLGSLGL